jgi:putative ABC transport system permease protein
MLLLARKNLLVYKGRFCLAVMGIATSVVLVLLLMGLYAGWREHMSAYLQHVRADLWIGQKGASDLFHTLSLLPAAGEQPLREVEGVGRVSSFVGRLMTAEVRGARRHVFIVGVQDNANGPVAIVAGTDALHDGEIVIDRVFARKEGIALGEMFTVADAVLRVVGIATGGNCFLYQYAFVTLSQAQRLFGLDGMVNYFLVQVSPPARQEDVMQRIQNAASFVSVFSKKQFIANNLSLTGDNFLPILRVLEVIGFLVGTVVIGLTMYTVTVERSAEYGVLKAIGAANAMLYGTVAQQALTCGLLGWLLGVPLSWGVVELAQQFVPQFPAASYLHHAIWMLGWTVAMSLIAAIIPVRRVARIDPLVAFKG